MTIYQISTERKRFRGTASELLDDLKNECAVLRKGKASDTLYCLLQLGNNDREVGHGAVGVYDDEGLRLDVNPFVVTRHQEEVVKNTESAREEELTKEKLEKYLGLTGFWHAYEALPAMGLSVMAPFNLVLRSEGWNVPHLYHFSLKGTGRNKVLECFTGNLFGTRGVHLDALKSLSGFASLIDQGCVPQTVYVTNNLSCNKSLLQKATNHSLLYEPSKSGRKYFSRSVLFFTRPIRFELELILFAA